MRGFERLDAAHMSYLATLIVDVTHNHPIMRTFIDLLRQQMLQKESITTSNDDVLLCGQRNQRILNKWFKLVTLINNPSLVQDRLRQRHMNWLHNRESQIESTLKRRAMTGTGDNKAFTNNIPV
jgi:hypothetical protein